MAPQDDLTAERAAIDMYNRLFSVMRLPEHEQHAKARLKLFYQVTRQEALREPIQWLKEFIEWNACYEQSGTYQCNQCGRKAIPGQSNHDEDCDIVTARALLDRLASEGG